MTRILMVTSNSQAIYDTIGTFTKEDNSDKEDEKKIAVSESQPPHSDRQLVSYTDSDSNGEPCNSK